MDSEPGLKLMLGVSGVVDRDDGRVGTRFGERRIYMCHAVRLSSCLGVWCVPVRPWRAHPSFAHTTHRTPHTPCPQDLSLCCCDICVVKFVVVPMSETAAAPPEAKKAKTIMNKYPEAPDEEWPEAWLMTEEGDDKEAFDQCKPNKQTPNVPVDAAAMRALGIHYWKLDATAYEYPVKAIPWDPKDAPDPKLAALRDDRGYNYADIITIHPDHLPEFDKKIAAFFEEHIHDAGTLVLERKKRNTGDAL